MHVCRVKMRGKEREVFKYVQICIYTHTHTHTHTYTPSIPKLSLSRSTGTHDAEEACIEYRMRVSEKKAEEGRKRNRGLGGLVRSKIGGTPTDLDHDELR